MLKKTITYTDYNDVERTEDFYFNITRAEVIEMEMTTTGGMIAMIEKITAAQDTPTLFRLFKNLILKAYGEKSDDGKAFMKSEAISDAFSYTEAYSELLTELVTDADKASEFVNGILPKPDKKQNAVPAK